MNRIAADNRSRSIFLPDCYPPLILYGVIPASADPDFVRPAQAGIHRPGFPLSRK